MTQSSQSIRKKILSKRRALQPSEIAEYSTEINQQILRSRQFRTARCIAAYLGHNGEALIDSCIDAAFAQKKQVCLPVLDPVLNGRLRFIRIHANTKYIRNRYGILEPKPLKCDACKINTIDLALIPLVAFDDQGSRIGMGGGYYDRSFAFLNHRKIWKRPTLMGVAYNFQFSAARIQTNHWDIPMQYVATQSEIHSFSH